LFIRQFNHLCWRIRRLHTY